MPREQRTEVLVVGAGPAGMLTALLLARAGVQVGVIDSDWRTASRTYACALHPRTLRILGGLGVADELLASGRRVNKVAFYEGESRRAEADLTKLSTEFPFVLVTPQSAFEHLLEEKLKQAGVQVQWNHQLSALRAEGPSIVAAVDTLGISAKGYIIPEMDWSVEKTVETRANYVIGADGPNSFVVQWLAAGYETVGEPEFYAVYEFESDWKGGDELRVVLDKSTTSILWPLAGNKFRWSFQLRQEHLRDFPAKERSAVLIGQPGLDQANREFIQKLIRQRAPWFDGQIQELGWSTDVEFQHRVVQRFGQDHCWLVGDAAHQTGPAGMQSMNRGMLEAEQLANCLKRMVRERASSEALTNYSQSCQEEWRRLLGLSGGLKPKPKTDGWIREHSSRILPCIPASGDDLRSLLDQLQLDWV